MVKQAAPSCCILQAIATFYYTRIAYICCILNPLKLKFYPRAELSPKGTCCSVRNVLPCITTSFPNAKTMPDKATLQ